MIEIIKTFARARRFEKTQSGEVEGKYYTRHGGCNTCGKCCTNIYLIHEDKTVESLEEFEALKSKAPEYEHFTPLEIDEHGVRFQCQHLQPDKRCGIYEDRPSFCRQYPSERGVLLGGQLAEGCGYWFELKTHFDEILQKAAEKQQKKAKRA